MIRDLLMKAALRVAEAYGNNQYALASVLGRLPSHVPALDRAAQIQLTLRYRELARAGAPLPSFDDAELRVFSQNGEDGILLYLFALIGTTNKRVVEMCAGSGIDCCAANLIVHHGWEGLLFDGQERKLRMGRRFYTKNPDTRQWPPKLVSAWITAENVNELIRKQGFAGEVDLFSLDMDGVDYWVWKALDAINPRVVILEYQDILGPKRSVTVPYDANFAAVREEHGPNYCGASLTAYTKLAREKGYRLVGSQRLGYNAFFLRNDVGEEYFPEVSVASCFAHPRTTMGQKKRYPRVAKKNWVEV